MSPKSPTPSAPDGSEDFEDHFESPTSGFIVTHPNGEIARCNRRFADWLGYDVAELRGKRLSSLLAIGGKMYHETHLAPLLRIQGFFDEVALEFTCRDGTALHCYVNAYERRDEAGRVRFVRWAAYRAMDRRTYEQNLVQARSAAEGRLAEQIRLAGIREQFVAVLGHDLRNPLGAMTSGVELLSRLGTARSDQERALLGMMKSAAARMDELIANVMDFARVRLGDGLTVSRTPTNVEPLLEQVIEELRLAYPGREITREIRLAAMVNCDGGRLGQLFSNLVANALTHGAVDQPVRVFASTDDAVLEVSVGNGGKPIPADSIPKLFEPFTREDVSPSKQGLGLGLFIAAAIARAHEGTLSAASSETETRFTFRMAAAP